MLINVALYMEQSKNKILAKLVIPWLLFLLSLGANGYFSYRLYFAAKSPAVETSQQQIAGIIDAVSKLIVLPTDETPTIATVTNLADVQKEWPELFANAKVGDKVLIYARSQKAILYDPTANIIVQLAPLTMGTASSSSQ